MSLLNIFRDPYDKKEVALLWAIYEIEQAQLAIQRDQLHVLKRILNQFAPDVTSFKITQTGDSPMADLAQPIPGATLVYTLTDEPAGSALPAGVVPVWTSSDETNAPVTASTDGTVGTVVLSASSPVGTVYTITATATLPDGTTPTGSVTISVVAPPTPEPTSFVLTQTA